MLAIFDCTTDITMVLFGDIWCKLMKDEKWSRFSIQIPPNLKVQIQQRARINLRSLNMEIVALLEAAIDASTRNDQALIEALLRGKPEPRTEQTETAGPPSA